MECNKKIKRSFYNLFTILSCNNCHNEIIYDYIYIGNNTINIYIINNECINSIKKQNMIRLFLKDSIINNDDIYIIIDIKEYYKYFDILPLFIDNNNLFVLII